MTNCDHRSLYFEPIDYTGPIHCYTCGCDMTDMDVVTVGDYPIPRGAVDMCPECAARLRDAWREDGE